MAFWAWVILWAPELAAAALVVAPGAELQPVAEAVEAELQRAEPAWA